MLFASDDVVWISWQYSADERVLSLRHNEVIDAYVTAGARIHLYGFLDKLQEKAIYTDTGDNLGQMQSELKKGEIIMEVVCAGPKNYAYKTYNTTTGDSNTVSKVRGITIIARRNW